MSAASIDDLIKEFGIQEFTKEDFERDKKRLEEKFITKFNLQPSEINQAIRDLKLSCMDPLVEEWVSLHALCVE